MGKRSSFNSRSKRHRREQLVSARRRFRIQMQERTDLYALTFGNRSLRREAVSRLEVHDHGIPCWDLDRERRLIVGRQHLVLFKGLAFRKARVVTQRHLLARLNRILSRHCWSGHHTQSVALERIWAYLQTTRYFLETVCRSLQITYLHALAYARQQERLLSFSATTLG